MQRASLVEKSRQKPQEKIKIVTDVSSSQNLKSYNFHSQICTYLRRFIWQALKNYRYDEDPVLAQCGVKIDRQLTQLDGRVLESPKVNLPML